MCSPWAQEQAQIDSLFTELTLVPGREPGALQNTLQTRQRTKDVNCSVKKKAKEKCSTVQRKQTSSSSKC